MKNGTLWGIIVLGILVILVGWWWFASQNGQTQSVDETGEVAGTEEEEFIDNSKDGAADPSAVGEYTVRYSQNGFSPETITVPVGATVIFVDEGTGRMWAASDEHPTHTNYAGTSRTEHCEGGAPSQTAFDQCAPTTSYSFTFTKAGSWDYHNHLNASHRGTVIVE